MQVEHFDERACSTRVYEVEKSIHSSNLKNLKGIKFFWKYRRGWNMCL